jgi:glycosyltransferase involved in cell wall biosynthesis
LGSQSITPLEILVVDQTRAPKDVHLKEDFADLPLEIIELPNAGQSSSRNAGLNVARGDYILFLDDDVDISPQLIEKHAELIDRLQADASCGVAEEVGAGVLPNRFRIHRESDVFPTNNTLIARSALAGCGLFDLAYDKGERADRDLGMRLYLAGRVLVLNPDARVLHHRAPTGGLRAHGARVVTYAASRTSPFKRQILSPSEAYLWLRYYTKKQVSSAILIRILGTFSRRGSRLQRAVRLFGALTMLIGTWRRTVRSVRTAEQMLETYPRIPALSDHRGRAHIQQGRD